MLGLPGCWGCSVGNVTRYFLSDVRSSLDYLTMKLFPRQRTSLGIICLTDDVLGHRNHTSTGIRHLLAIYILMASMYPCIHYILQTRQNITIPGQIDHCKME